MFERDPRDKICRRSKELSVENCNLDNRAQFFFLFFLFPFCD